MNTGQRLHRLMASGPEGAAYVRQVIAMVTMNAVRTAAFERGSARFSLPPLETPEECTRCAARKELEPVEGNYSGDSWTADGYTVRKDVRSATDHEDVPS